VVRRAAFALLIASCAKQEREEPSATPDATPAERTMEEECEAVRAHLRAVAPELLDPEDEFRYYCPRMPRPVVRCLLGVRTQAEADRCVQGFAGEAAP
jgi:hypothetical protein